jgi:hypothetical protein
LLDGGPTGLRAQVRSLRRARSPAKYPSGVGGLFSGTSGREITARRHEVMEARYPVNAAGNARDRGRRTSVGAEVGRCMLNLRSPKRSGESWCIRISSGRIVSRATTLRMHAQSFVWLGDGVTRRRRVGRRPQAYALITWRLSACTEHLGLRYAEGSTLYQRAREVA